MNTGHIGYSPDFKSETHKANIRITKITKAKPPKLEDEFISKLLAEREKFIGVLEDAKRIIMLHTSSGHDVDNVLAKICDVLEKQG